MTSGLKNRIDSFLKFDDLQESRVKILETLSSSVLDELRKTGSIQLNFLCTHNSRRSQLAQVWAHTACVYFGLDTKVSCHSSGTEATAFNPRAVEALKADGFDILSGDGDNPVYQILFDEEPSLSLYSKTIDEVGCERFLAIMTCSDADENCPFIPQAIDRIPLRYADPKEFDDTPLEEEKYVERSRQIGQELFYVFSKVKSLI